jgi:hypothetical protein
LLRSGAIALAGFVVDAGAAMKKLGLSRLLHVLVLVPLLALAVFGGLLVYDGFNDYQKIERVSALEQVVTAASRLTIKALNRESDASHAFVASGAERERDALMAARQGSDLAIRALQSATASSSLLDAKARELVGDIEMQLRGLDGFRAKTDGRTLVRRDFWRLPAAADLASRRPGAPARAADQ